MIPGSGKKSSFFFFLVIIFILRTFFPEGQKVFVHLGNRIISSVKRFMGAKSFLQD